MPKNNTLPEGFTVQQPQQSDGRFFIPPGSLDIGAAAIPGSVSAVAMGAGSVTFSALVLALQQSLVPAGTLLDFGGSSAPSGYILCDGSVVSQATYANLFAAIGSNFNTGGEGAGNFRLPDARGRTLIGAGTGPGLSTRTLGQTGGEETHTLSTAEIPGHTHNYSGNTGGYSADHSHNFAYNAFSGTSPLSNGNNGPAPYWFSQYAQGGTTSGQSANHSHFYSGTTDTGSVGGSSHNNMQPFLACTKIIKF